jgi:hypothetical protein
MIYLETPSNTLEMNNIKNYGVGYGYLLVYVVFSEEIRSLACHVGIV